MELTEKDIKRFWKKVDKRGINECWEWQAALSKFGYGYFRLDYKMVKAHRVSYFLAYGNLPDMDIGHLCDNRKCVSPFHVTPQTSSENVQQAFDHGNLKPMKGEAHPRHKLTDAQVREILRLKGTLPKGLIAFSFAVSIWTINDIFSGKHWAHLR